jgi:hypothetical protein
MRLEIFSTFFLLNSQRKGLCLEIVQHRLCNFSTEAKRKALVLGSNSNHGVTAAHNIII